MIGLARRHVSRAPMELLKHALLTTDKGLHGDSKGEKFPDRQLTILALEDWDEAMLDIAGPAGPPQLPWTTRRANLLVQGIRLPRGIGSILRIRDCMLKVTAQTTPCVQMEMAHAGLLSALSSNWRGGITCKVLTGGAVALNDNVTIMVEQPEFKVRLPA